MPGNVQVWVAEDVARPLHYDVAHVRSLERDGRAAAAQRSFLPRPRRRAAPGAPIMCMRAQEAWLSRLALRGRGCRARPRCGTAGSWTGGGGSKATEPALSVLHLTPIPNRDW